jgi:transcriptional regulator with XRE-family HTH domain
MAIPDRVSIIIGELGVTQKQFAESLSLTPAYISRLLKGELGMAKTTAMLIERVHGYSRDWILTGAEPKMAPNAPAPLSPLQRRIITEVGRMTDEELFFVNVYIEAVRKKKETAQPSGSPTQCGASAC